MTRMTKHSWLYLTTALLALAAGCGAPLPRRRTPRARPSWSAPWSRPSTSADVTSVRVTVSAADMPARTAELVKTNNQWSGLIGKLPAGTGRTFSAEAFNSAGTKLYAGAATGVTILAKQTTAVSITLQEVNPRGALRQCRARHHLAVRRARHRRARRHGDTQRLGLGCQPGRHPHLRLERALGHLRPALQPLHHLDGSLPPPPPCPSPSR